MRIDTLDKVIPEGDLNTFYTNVNPDNYYNENAKPIAEKLIRQAEPMPTSQIRLAADIILKP